MARMAHAEFKIINLGGRILINGGAGRWLCHTQHIRMHN